MSDTETTGATPTGKGVFPPRPSFSEKAHIQSIEQYKAMYKRSIEDPDGFWAEVAEQFYWK